MMQTLVKVSFVLQVNSKWQAGDQDGAMRSAKEAKTWSIAGLVCGIITLLISITISAVYYVMVVKEAIDEAFEFDTGYTNYGNSYD